PTWRRAEPDDVAERRGVAQRAAQIAPVGDWQEAAREGDRGAAAAAPAGLREIPGIARRTEHGVERLRARTEFGGVRLPAGDRARRPEPGDDGRVGRRNVIAVEG